MLKEQVDAAILAHSRWKARLREAIDTGKSAFDPATVGLDNQCDFGKLIYSLDSTVTSDPHFAVVRKHHADFHQEAARVLKLALEGKKAEAEQAIALGSPFSSVSSQCIMALTDWKNKIQ